MLDTLAGGIFTNQELFIYGIITFIIASLLLGTALFVSTRIFNKATARKKTKSLNLVNATLLGFGIIAALLLFFFIMPTVIEDRNWLNKQQDCAREVGYESPADNNSISVTAKEQSDYDDCLNR
ncbi:MAG: hypothetical protein QG623_6 [Patescibacteria group bacterium]|nr:hypothetical protein [Patescibacteria group bacterium]